MPLRDRLGEGLRLLARVAVRSTRYDRRVTFRSLDRITSRRRTAHTAGIQFYSGHPNIGNYLPVLGIHRMLGHALDAWNIHHRPIDFAFVNKNYNYAVIGGAGLLHAVFEPFWKSFAEECRVPYVVWGVGGCFPDAPPLQAVPPEIARPVLQAAELVNLRDVKTADFYDVPTARISACPTVIYLRDLRTKRRPEAGLAVFSSHEPLVGALASKETAIRLQKLFQEVRVTDNVQSRTVGLQDIVARFYLPSEVVVTTRLHGAIIAYGLNIPYVAIARDEKVRDFHRLYRNGIVIETLDQLEDAILGSKSVDTSSIAYEPVERFGDEAKALISSFTRHC